MHVGDPSQPRVITGKTTRSVITWAVPTRQRGEPLLRQEKCMPRPLYRSRLNSTKVRTFKPDGIRFDNVSIALSKILIETGGNAPAALRPAQSESASAHAPISPGRRPSLHSNGRFTMGSNIQNLASDSPYARLSREDQSAASSR